MSEFSEYFTRLRNHPVRQRVTEDDRRIRRQQLQEGMDPPLPQPFRAAKNLISGAKEVATGVIGGVSDAAETTVNKAIQDTGVSVDLPDAGNSESLLHQIPRSLTNFAAAFVPARRMVGGGALANDLRAGAVADFVAFKNQEGNFSDLAISLGFDNVVTGFLSGERSETELEASLKTALEGVGMGAAFNGLSRAYRIIRDNPQYRKEVIGRLMEGGQGGQGGLGPMRQGGGQVLYHGAPHKFDSEVTWEQKHPRGSDGKFIKKSVAVEEAGNAENP